MANEKNVEVYSHESCPSCEKAKKYLKDRGKEVEERHIKEKIEEGNGPQAMKVPLICKGDDCVAGYNPEEIDELLGE